MSVGDNDITMSVIATELGISIGTNRLKSSLTRHVNITKWSFFRSGSIDANVTTKLVEFTAPSSNDKAGDFRRYDQSTTTPFTQSDYTHKWGPSGTTTTLIFVITPVDLNIKEIGTGDYYTFKFYSSAADRTNKTSSVKTHIVAIDYDPVTPPVGHTNNQTSRPDSPQQITVTGVTTSHSVLYMDSFISDISGNEKIRFDDSHTDITMEEYEQALMRCTQSIVSADLPSGNSPAGYAWSETGSRLQIYTASTPKDSSSDVNQTYGSSAYSFYWVVVLADTDSNFYTAGITSIDLKTYLDDGSMSYDQTIETGASNTDPTTQSQSSGSISGASFDYDDIWKVYYDTSSGITYNSVYSLI